MIRISNLYIKYDKLILDHETIIIPSGKITLIKGVSGVGKTALLYRIALIGDDQSFSFEVDGKEIKDFQQFRKDHISFVLQDIDFFPHYSIYQTIEYFAKLNNIDMHTDKARELLDKVQLDNDINQNVMTLSLGEKQRLSIVCALIKQPSLLILDEPTASLDEENERVIFEILNNLASEGIAIVIASHSDMAQEYADHIYIFENTYLKLIKDDMNNKPLISTTHHDVSSSFLKEYAIRYMQSYRFIYVFLIMILTLSLLSGSMFNLLTDYAKSNSLEVLQGQFDNKLIITNDESKYVNQTYTNYMISCDENNAYPLYQMIATINDEDIDIVPYFKDNRLDKYLSSYFSNDKDGVYMDTITYFAYQNLTDKTLEITINDQNTQYVINKQVSVNGALQESFEQHYSTNTQRFIYMSYDMMKDIYESMNLSHQYIGYVIVYDSFSQLKEGKTELEKQGYTINDTFIDIDVMNALINYYRILQIIITGIIVVLTLIVDIILISHIHLQKHKESNILRLSGLFNKQLIQLDLYEYIIEIFISMIITFITILIVFLVSGSFSLSRLLLMIGILILYFILLFIERIIVIYKELHQYTMEKVLRESEGE